MNIEILNLIKKQCQGKPHIKLTVGCISNGQTTINVFNETGETEYSDYIYEIGSVTKTFTASLLAKHIHEGKISLDDSIDKYIGGLGQKSYYPTIRRLITHTSGYARRLPMSKSMSLRGLFVEITNETIASALSMDEQKMREIINEVNLSDKDYKWQYSNFGIALVGYAIGVTSGKGYKAAMNEFLTHELGLENSYTGTCPGNNLLGFSKKNSTGGNWVWGDNLLAPAGDISSTAKDLLRYAEINFNDEFPYLSVCHQKHAKLGFPFAQMLDMDMGLGWWVGKKENTIAHGGDTATFSSVLLADKKHKTAVIVLSNYPGNSLKLAKIAKPLLQKINQNSIVKP